MMVRILSARIVYNIIYSSFVTVGDVRVIPKSCVFVSLSPFSKHPPTMSHRSRSEYPDIPSSIETRSHEFQHLKNVAWKKINQLSM